MIEGVDGLFLDDLDLMGNAWADGDNLGLGHGLLRVFLHSEREKVRER
jgi:hypothetical protein